MPDRAATHQPPSMRTGSGEATLSWVVTRAERLEVRFAVGWSAYPGACFLTRVISS